MARFSERYAYVSNVIVKDYLPKSLQNELHNWMLSVIEKDILCFYDLNYDFWVNFLFEKKEFFPDIYNCYESPIIEYIDNDDIEWYKKLDAIEYVFYSQQQQYNITDIGRWDKEFNNILKRHNFAYRFINGLFIEVTSDEECVSINGAINNPLEGVRSHLKTALEKLSASQPHPDYRNSIKESISAVECLCRNITNESTLDRALKKLESKGIVLNAQMKKGLENLYYYTNDGNTGIRHALMDDMNAPCADEAIFMLVSCSAFINYITKKISNNGN